MFTLSTRLKRGTLSAFITTVAPTWPITTTTTCTTTRPLTTLLPSPSSPYYDRYRPDRHNHRFTIPSFSSSSSSSPQFTASLLSSTPSSSPSSASPSSVLLNSGYRPGDRVILFDGVCILCNAGVDLILRFDTSNHFKLAALQSPVGLALLDKFDAPKDLSTVVLIDADGSAHTKSDAVLRIARYLNWYFALPAHIVALTIPRPVRNLMYTHVLAKHRYFVFGKRDTCRLVDPQNQSKFLL